MTPQSYATSLIYRGHTPQSVKLATGCDVSNRTPRRAFDPVKLKSPLRSGEEKLGPPIYTRYEKIMADVDSLAFKYGITRADILSQDRKRKYSWPRQEAYFLLHRKWGLSLPRTGQILGKDHSTVHYGVVKYEARNAL